jgi:Aldo/keto reductase family
VQESDVVPAVNQIEVHPYLGNEEIRAANADFGIVTEAWSPLAKGRVLNDPTIGAIASRVDRTPAQVVLRWHIQRGDVIFPKSTTPARIKENLQIFDFELESHDIAAINALDRGEEGRIGPNPDVFASWGPAPRLNNTQPDPAAEKYMKLRPIDRCAALQPRSGGGDNPDPGESWARQYPDPTHQRAELTRTMTSS